MAGLMDRPTSGGSPITEDELNNTSLNDIHISSCKKKEFENRAVVMRKKIEHKLDEIEAEIQVENKELAQRVDENEDVSELPEIIQNKRFVDMKRSRSYSLAEMKDTAIARLKTELDNAQLELQLKDKEVSKLSRIRDEVGLEIEELTASLFEEANNMVKDANMKRVAAEKQVKETSMKLTILQEEVSALKNLIKSTIPCFSNNAQSFRDEVTNSADNKSPLKKSVLKGKFPSCSDLPLGSQCLRSSTEGSDALLKEKYETDPVLHKEFVAWRQNPRVDKCDPFLKRVYVEDIEICMNFENKELSKKVLAAVEENRIIVEKLGDKPFIPKTCDLLMSPRFCHYRMNLGDSQDYYISSLGRNRIAAVCDFLNYLRYIENGLIKNSIHDVYLEVLRKRKAIVLARLGLPSDSIS